MNEQPRQTGWRGNLVFWIIVALLLYMLYAAATAPPIDDGGDPYRDAPVGRAGRDTW